MKLVDLPLAHKRDVNEALNLALEDDLQDVLILGYDADGVLGMRSSHMNNGQAMIMVEQAKKLILGY